MDFTGKVAISTGAASGMGLLFAENFAALGGDVVMCDVNEAVLAEKGNMCNVREVVAVCVPDRPGGMAEVMQVIDASGSNVEYSYAFAFHGGEKAVLVFRFADNALAEKALAEAAFTTLNEREIGDAVKNIRQTGCKMLGAVLNGVKFRSLSNKHYYYSSERYSGHYSKRYKYGRKAK